VTEVADTLGLPKSTVYNQLKSLESQALVFNEGGAYELGLRLFNLGMHARRKKEEFVRLESKVEELAEQTGERAQFIVEEAMHAVHLYTKVGPNGVDIGTDVGTRRHDLHAIAAGKVILATVSEDRLEAFLETSDFEKFTKQTIADKSTLRDTLETVRMRGYAFNDEESMDGLRAIAVPVQYPNGNLLGVLGVTGPSHRMKGNRYEEEIPDLLLGVSNEVELNIGSM
jgi:DNA-binding IclR family transcriptional regulator